MNNFYYKYMNEEIIAIKDDIKRIEERNRRVELDKSWEISWLRRLIIALMTYVLASVWLAMIHETDFLLKAIIPVAGYVLSTMTLNFIKNKWLEKKIVN